MHAHYRYWVLLITIALPINAKKVEQKNNRVLSTTKKDTVQKQSPKKITNAITKKDIGYSYLFAKRYPEKFTVTVNNKELKFGESTTITDTDTFEVGYDYEWWAPWQTYKGSGTKKYRIPAHTNEVKISFLDWHNPGRITVEKAELLDENRTFADSKKQSAKGSHSRKRHGK